MLLLLTVSAAGCQNVEHAPWGPQDWARPAQALSVEVLQLVRPGPNAVFGSPGGEVIAVERWSTQFEAARRADVVIAKGSADSPCLDPAARAHSLAWDREGRLACGLEIGTGLFRLESGGVLPPVFSSRKFGSLAWDGFGGLIYTERETRWVGPGKHFDRRTFPEHWRVTHEALVTVDDVGAPTAWEPHLTFRGGWRFTQDWLVTVDEVGPRRESAPGVVRVGGGGTSFGYAATDLRGKRTSRTVWDGLHVPKFQPIAESPDGQYLSLFELWDRTVTVVDRSGAQVLPTTPLPGRGASWCPSSECVVVQARVEGAVVICALGLDGSTACVPETALETAGGVFVAGGDVYFAGNDVGFPVLGVLRGWPVVAP